MPTATAFDAAARSLDRAAADLTQLLIHAPGHLGSDTLVGGMLTIVSELTVATAQSTAVATASTLAAQADICRARAEACRAFAAELDRYHVEVGRFEADMRSYDPTDPYAFPPQRPNRPRPVANFIEV